MDADESGSKLPHSCAIKSMNSVSESLNSPADRKPVQAEGNCAVATPGGEQPEVKVRSQTSLPRPVNPIRPVRRARLRVMCEACRVSGEPRTAHPLSMLERGRRKGSWGENAPKRAWMTMGDRRGRLTRVGVRALIGATKPGNAGGAKERRKVNTR